MNIDLDSIELTKMPDGMPHLKFGHPNEREYQVNARIRTAEDLVKLMLLTDVLDKHADVSTRRYLNLLYLSSGRMDRPIDDHQPFTLRVFATAINNLHYNTITLHCPHSNQTRLYLGNCFIYDDAVFFKPAIMMFQHYVCNYNISIVYPDKGAKERWGEKYNSALNVLCEKVRDSQTGKLSGFKVLNPENVMENCLIIDDLCDGGGTFAGISTELRKAGAKTVGLAVYHGIFSKGLPISGIDYIYTTNSFKNWSSDKALKLEVIDVI